MKKVKRWWMALLLGALLMAIVVGVAGARPSAQTTFKVTLPAGHFHPYRAGIDWWNDGNVLYLPSGSGFFTAALPIALPGRFTVEKLTLFAFDNGPANVCALLYRVNPWTGVQDEMATVCTTSNSTSRQILSTTTITPATIYGAHGAYVMVQLPLYQDVEFYAVQLDYH